MEWRIKRVALVFSFSLLAINSNAQDNPILLSEIIDTVFCEQQIFERVGFREDSHYIIKYINNTKSIYVDTPENKCNKFYFELDEKSMLEILNRGHKITYLYVVWKQIEVGKAEILLETELIDKAFYESNQEGGPKFFIRGSKWWVNLQCIKGKWIITNVKDSQGRRG